MKTEENNKFIAEFMGIRYEENRNGHESSEYFYEDCELEYHSSWDWLMPVVEKIENIEYVNRMGRFNVNAISFEENYTCVITDSENTFIQVEGETKRVATYKAVVEFIKWYNKWKLWKR
jgi:hypothetical protein